MASSKRPQSEVTSGEELDILEKPRKRVATVYDAVAGRISQWGFIDSDRPSATLKPLRPDEVLYKSQKAPTRYEETDHYFASSRLSPDKKLPSSDLLSALHGYFSEFYERSEEQVSRKIWRSMDETALIALGILMEETARSTLGETGDLAFLEAAESEDEVAEKKEKEEATEETAQAEPVEKVKRAPTSDVEEVDSFSSAFSSPNQSEDSDSDD